MTSRLTILQGDALEKLRSLPDESVHCCVTSPPYWGLRDYGVAGQLGLEKHPDEYLTKMVEIFREVRRVLRRDGTAWVNMGDCYHNVRVSTCGQSVHGGQLRDKVNGGNRSKQRGLKPKDLCGMPWRLAFALQADGWWLRSDIIWAKPNPMPESVTDRPTKAHEYVFLLSKRADYFYDAEAVRIPLARVWDDTNGGSWAHTQNQPRGTKAGEHSGNYPKPNMNGANRRTVWTIPTAPYSEAHFATYPPDLVKPCILAGTSARGCCPKCGAPWERVVETEKSFQSGSGRSGNPISGKQDLHASETNSTPDIRMGPVVATKTTGWRPTCGCGETAMLPCTVLDPFAGSGTTGMVALELGRRAVLVELNPDYVRLIERRCDVTQGLPLA